MLVSTCYNMILHCCSKNIYSHLKNIYIKRKKKNVKKVKGKKNIDKITNKPLETRFLFNLLLQHHNLNSNFGS